MPKIFSYFPIGLLVIMIYLILAQPTTDTLLLGIAVVLFLYEIFMSQQVEA